MKWIQKSSTEPSKLVQYRSTPGATYEDMDGDVNQDLRKHLIQDQGYICCYCMRRLTLNHDCTKIEHYKPRKIYNGTNGKPNLKLTYSNMLLACVGQAQDENGEKTICCDSKKAHTELFYINPLSKNIETQLKYTSLGVIYSHDKNIDTELKEVLNLNNQSLKDERKGVYKSVSTIIKSAEDRNKCNLSYLNALLDKWYKTDKDGKFKPFCMVAVQIITKKIKEYTFKSKKK